MSLTLSQAVTFLDSYSINFTTLSAQLQATQNTLNNQNSTLTSLILSAASASTLQSQRDLIVATSATLASQQASLVTLTSTYKVAKAVVNANALTTATGPTGTAFTPSVGFTGPVGPPGSDGVSPTGPTGPGGNVSNLDTTPTSGSSNAVTSNGVYQAINALAASSVATSMTASNSTVGTLALVNNSLYVCTSPFSPMSNLDTDSSLLYYLPFDAGSISGGTVTAAVGSSITAESGTGTILPTIDTSKYVYGTGSVGISTFSYQYINFPTTNLASNFTISFFMNMPSYPTTDGTVVVKFGNLGISFAVSATRLCFTNNPLSSVTLPDVAPLNSWVYVAWVVSGTSWTMYMNGTKYTFTSSNTVPGANQSPCRLGCVTTSDTFNGNIDEFRLYNRPLFENEIANLYARYTKVGTWNCINV